MPKNLIIYNTCEKKSIIDCSETHYEIRVVNSLMQKNVLRMFSVSLRFLPYNKESINYQKPWEDPAIGKLDEIIKGQIVPLDCMHDF